MQSESERCAVNQRENQHEKRKSEREEESRAYLTPAACSCFDNRLTTFDGLVDAT